MKIKLMLLLCFVSLRISASAAAKSWRECSHGNKLPNVPFLVKFGTEGICISTPTDEDQVAQLTACNEFSAMIQSQTTQKIREKYCKPGTSQYKPGQEPKTATFKLLTTGEIEEVFEDKPETAAAAKK